MKTKVRVEFDKGQCLIHWKAAKYVPTSIEYNGKAESYEKFIYDVMLKQPQHTQGGKDLC